MHDLNHNEDRPRGTYEFPFEFHHIDHTHPRYVMSYHWHVEYEIIRILEGSLTVTLDEKSFTAVNNPVCGEYIQKILHQETMLFPHFSDEHPQILNCISVLFDAMYEKDTGYELTVFGQFYHFFGLVFSNHYFIENPTRTRRDYKRILQLKQVLEFIEKNYANPITLQELSASVSMSPKYFCRFFSEMTHQTPVDYLNRQRIEEACLQLAATDDSITEIAYRNGFNDLSYFIRTFKKYKGMTPGKYKRR